VAARLGKVGTATQVKAGLVDRRRVSSLYVEIGDFLDGHAARGWNELEQMILHELEEWRTKPEARTPSAGH